MPPNIERIFSVKSPKRGKCIHKFPGDRNLHFFWQSKRICLQILEMVVKIRWLGLCLSPSHCWKAPILLSTNFSLNSLPISPTFLANVAKLAIFFSKQFVAWRKMDSVIFSQNRLKMHKFLAEIFNMPQVEIYFACVLPAWRSKCSKYLVTFFASQALLWHYPYVFLWSVF